jgi:hypothetical protein
MKLTRQIVITSCCIAAVSQWSYSQATHGTAIISITTEDFAVVAADSFERGGHTDTKACKISLAGTNSIAYVGGTTETNYASTGSIMLQQAKVENNGDFIRVITQWAQWMKGRLQSLAASPNSGIAPESTGTSATLVALNSQGKIIAGHFTAPIRVLAPGRYDVSLGPGTFNSATKDSNGGNVAGHAAAATITEIKAGTTQRAKANQYIWENMKHGKNHEQLIKTAKDFVVLAEKWYPADAGGDIDIVTLDENGAIWKKIKPNCVRDTLKGK